MSRSTSRCRGCGCATPRRVSYCSTDCQRRHRLSVAAELADDARADLDATPLSPALVAKHGSRCPLCTTYVAAGKSKIVAITETYPIVVHTDRDGWPERRRTRRWAHESCVLRYAQNPIHEEDR